MAAHSTSSSSSSKRLLVLGLDQSGKSSLLSALAAVSAADRVQQQQQQQQTLPMEVPLPTERLNIVTVQGSGSSLDIVEVGGAGRLRQSWPDYMDGIDALVFVVDSANVQRLPEARDEVLKLLANPKLVGKPVVVIANKQDLPAAASPSTVLGTLGLMAADLGSRKVHVMGAEVTPGSPCLCTDDILSVLDSLWQV